MPILVIAAAAERLPVSALEERGYRIASAHTGALLLDCVREMAPDAIVVDVVLPDMSGEEACSRLRDEPHIGYRVPILLLAPEPPTPDQRVGMLRAGAWDVLSAACGVNELVLRLDTYIQAKRNLDVALSERAADPAGVVHNRAGLARRARELGALMARKHGALANIVFAVEGVPAIPMAHVALQATRMSDVVGVLGPSEVAVLAPATDHVGAVSLARRVAGVLRARGGDGRIEAGTTLLVGYDAVVNITYSPFDPMDLITRATTAIRHGVPEPNCSWVRRFNSDAAEPVRARPSPRSSPIP